MIESTARRGLRVNVYVLLAAFVAVFAAGFAPWPSHLFLLPLLCLAVAAVALLRVAVGFVDGRVRRFSLLAAIAALGFVAGVVYGTLGMRGLYEIVDAVYIPLVMISAVGFLAGAAGSLTSIRSSEVPSGRG